MTLLEITIDLFPYTSLQMAEPLNAQPHSVRQDPTNYWVVHNETGLIVHINLYLWISEACQQEQTIHELQARVNRYIPPNSAARERAYELLIWHHCDGCDKLVPAPTLVANTESGPFQLCRTGCADKFYDEPTTLL